MTANLRALMTNNGLKLDHLDCPTLSCQDVAPGQQKTLQVRGTRSQTSGLEACLHDFRSPARALLSAAPFHDADRLRP